MHLFEWLFLFKKIKNVDKNGPHFIVISSETNLYPLERQERENTSHLKFQFTFFTLFIYFWMKIFEVLLFKESFFYNWIYFFKKFKELNRFLRMKHQYLSSQDEMKETHNRQKNNKEHKRKWPDNACCTIANKASTPCWLKYAFRILQTTLTWDACSQEIRLTCFDWSIRYTAPVFLSSWTDKNAVAPWNLSTCRKSSRDLIWVHYFSVYSACVWWNDDVR